MIIRKIFRIEEKIGKIKVKTLKGKIINVTRGTNPPFIIILKMFIS